MVNFFRAFLSMPFLFIGILSFWLFRLVAGEYTWGLFQTYSEMFAKQNGEGGE